MTTNRKKKKTMMGGRAATVSLSLCLLALIAMAGMYAVGRSDQEQEELEQQVAEAEELAKAREEAQKEAQEEAQRKAQEEERQQELEEQRQEASSAATQRQKDEEKTETKTVVGAELESEFAVQPIEVAETVVTDDIQEAAGEAIAEVAETEQIPLSFSPDSNTLLWPVAGNIIMDYSMDKTVYFTTLDQYKYNPAVIIQGILDESVLCGAQGKVASIETLEETGTTVTMDIGNGYELIYGQLKELAVKEGDYVNEGETIGYVSEPTRFYSKEGCNVYFEVRKDGESIDPMSLLQ